MATTFNNLALMYSAQGQYSKADSYFQQALIIYEKTLGSEHPEVAVTLNSLALTYCEQGLFSKAEPILCQALSIYESTAEPFDQADLAWTLRNYADLLRKLDRPIEADMMESRAILLAI